MENTNSKEQFDFFAYIGRMKYIVRWGLMRNTNSENIQEHSLQVAILAHALAVIHNKLCGREELSPDRACVYAIFHDAGEIITGDLPTPVKYYNPLIKENYQAIEDVAKEKLLSMLPEEMGKVYRPILFYEQEDVKYYPIVKAADKLSAYIKCVEEVKAGNREFVKAMESTLEALQALELPEVSHFMSHYIEAYNKTLDEMN
ncbi:MAG: 5'-deoxynucleotidase [Clostridiales bacterium]|jgi:metal dependent phosphohydrolase|nr:5'-deoxynucleotidase [Clostridiales bacterium]